MRAADLQEPAAYGTGSVVLGGLLLLAVAVWLVVGWWLGRQRPGDDTEPARPAGGTRQDPYAGVRREHLDRLADVERRHAAGELDHREADLEVAAVVREFVTARAGVPARSLTAAELRSIGYTGGASDLVIDLLAPTFSPAGAGPESVPVALDRARQVVRAW